MLNALTNTPDLFTGGKAAGETNNEIVLSCRGLRRDFNGFTAVKDVDLDVEHCRIHALIGPNGAGKTTVFNLLTKVLPATAGQIVFMGRDITRLSASKVANLGLVRSFQISAVFTSLTVQENLKIALQRRHNLASQFWRPLSALDRLNDRAEELIDKLGLSVFSNVVAADLSYGRKRALEIATTLAMEPKVLLLDEPLAGMGQEDISIVSNIIREVGRTHAVLMVEHNLKVVSTLCHKITVLQRGSILAAGDYASVASDPLVREAYMGSGHD